MKTGTNMQLQIPKYILVFINNLFEIQKKLNLNGDSINIKRNVLKMIECLEDMGITFEDPLGQPFSQTRSDLDASISGEGIDDLIVVDVLKPIIRAGTSNVSTVIQKGVVVVESKSKE